MQTIFGTRLERYASGKQESQKVVTGQGAIADLLAQSVALANLNKVVEQRDFGANLARELARADLRLKVSEYLAIWAGTTIGVPGATRDFFARSRLSRSSSLSAR